jgi:hypothetical protein
MSVQTSAEAGVWPHREAKPSEQRAMFRELEADLFLAHQLFRHGLSLTQLGEHFDGVTSPAQRRESLRRKILAADLDQALVLSGPRDRPPETLAQAFQRLYGEPLID